MRCSSCQAAFAAAPVSDTDRKQVLDAVIAHLEIEYIDPDVGRRAARKLRDKSVQTLLKNAGDGTAVAAALRDKLRAETGDGHLNFEFSEKELPADQAAADAGFNEQEMERYYALIIDLRRNEHRSR